MASRDQQREDWMFSEKSCSQQEPNVRDDRYCRHGRVIHGRTLIAVVIRGESVIPPQLEFLRANLGGRPVIHTGLKPPNWLRKVAYFSPKRRKPSTSPRDCLLASCILPRNLQFPTVLVFHALEFETSSFEEREQIIELLSKIIQGLTNATNAWGRGGRKKTDDRLMVARLRQFRGWLRGKRKKRKRERFHVTLNEAINAQVTCSRVTRILRLVYISERATIQSTKRCNDN